MRVRFNRWSGQQDPFPAAVTADGVLAEVSDELLAGHGLEEALQRLQRRGFAGASGLGDLRDRVAEARRRELARMGLEGPLQDIADRLGEIVDRERTALTFAAEAEAAQRLAALDELPRDVAARIAALQEHRWADAQAQRDFNELVEQLRRDVAEATFGRIAAAMGSMSEADMAALREMLGDLNDLVTRHAAGQDVQEDFAALKERHGQLLPGDPETLEELLEEMARRMAAMSRLMAGLDPEQRAQLAAMAEQLLGDADLAFQADQLQRALQGLYPELGWESGPGGAMPTGAESGSLSEAVDWVEHLSELEELASALAQDYPGARLEDIDEDVLRRSVGDDAVRDLRALREIERALEEAGAAQRSRGRLELTPRGIRALGERALAQVYDRAISGDVGSHATPSGGGDGELTGATRPLAFGDPFRLDVARTIGNAIMRSAGERSAGAGSAGARAAGERGVRLSPEDFELAEAERRVKAATVLLLDMSFSMPLRGNWVPAKRVALALQALVSSKFPEDRFYIVGFSDFARRIEPRDLLSTGWERVYGTNMQHAFMLARRLLAAHPGSEQQVIMVTDGEPTAHLEEPDDASQGVQAFFAWPPEPLTLRKTMEEASRLARTGATLNVFLLDHDPGAARFVEQMVSSYGGRIFYPDLADLGSLVMRDFLQRRS
jgi:uncharacterized protein with von Willebrand factor type A (vWA) domain